MRHLPSLLLSAAALLIFGACDSNGPEEAQAAPANASSCTAPSISTQNIGGYIHVTNYSSFGAVVEYKTLNGQWTHLGVAGTNDSSVATTLWPYLGNSNKERVDFRAKNICYNTSTDTYSYSSSGTYWVYYNTDGP